MAELLTKANKKGVRYTRPPDVEQAIDAAVKLPGEIAIQKSLIQAPADPGYLRSECLVYLIREARRRDDIETMNSLLAALFCRCHNILKSKVPDGSLPAAAELREDILGELGTLFALDGQKDDKGHLDFFECRFNLAFMALRISIVRKAQADADVLVPLPDGRNTDPLPEESRFAQLSKNLSLESTGLSKAQLSEAFTQMAPKDKEAFVLVYMMGYKIESIDSKEETAATRLQVSGRTIRSRLANAIETLKKYAEEPR
jgi:hypothetical protein